LPLARLANLPISRCIHADVAERDKLDPGLREADDLRRRLDELEATVTAGGARP